MPARVARTLDEEAAARLPRAAEGYVRNWQRYARGLTSAS
jgi:carbonic anhydrase/acetyltransferase-like protein (isoleucine patch superfamily)